MAETNAFPQNKEYQTPPQAKPSNANKAYQSPPQLQHANSQVMDNNANNNLSADEQFAAMHGFQIRPQENTLPPQAQTQSQV